MKATWDSGIFLPVALGPDPSESTAICLLPHKYFLRLTQDSSGKVGATKVLRLQAPAKGEESADTVRAEVGSLLPVSFL